MELYRLINLLEAINKNYHNCKVKMIDSWEEILEDMNPTSIYFLGEFEIVIKEEDNNNIVYFRSCNNKGE